LLAAALLFLDVCAHGVYEFAEASRPSFVLARGLRHQIDPLLELGGVRPLRFGKFGRLRVLRVLFEDRLRPP
jgi:hypothetical protein